MKSYQKRKTLTFNDMSLQIESNKRLKFHDAENLPFPLYIQCQAGKVEYVFDTMAEREGVQIFLENQLNEKMKCYQTKIELTSSQFNQWMNDKNAFNELMQIKEWLDNSGWMHFVAKLNDYSKLFIQQISLIKSKEILFEAIIETGTKNFSAFYSKIVTCEKLFNHIMKRRLADGNNILMLAAKYHKKEVIHLLRYINDETYQQLIYTTNENAETLLQILAKNGEGNILLHFMKRLPPDILIRLLLFHETPETIKFFNYSTSVLFKWINSLFEYPDVLKNICQTQTMLNYIRIFDGGDSIDSWSNIAKYILDATPPVKSYSTALHLSNQFKEIKIPKKLVSMPMSEMNQYQFIRFQGRTILFENEIKHIIAIKIQKKNEKLTDLIKEFRTTEYLYQNKVKLGLQSHYPKPSNLMLVTELKPWLENHIKNKKLQSDLLNMIGHKNKYMGYLYQVNPTHGNYFTYLHDKSISNIDFNKINRIAIHDLFTLLKQGVIFSQLADIFHNLEHVSDRADKGRYIVLVNLLRNFYKKGSGRLTNWRQSVVYPNVRASGLADLGDHISINELIGESERIKEYYSETWEMYQNKTCNYLLANVMAEYQYVLFLIAGCRGVELTKEYQQQKAPQEIITQLWHDLANQMLDNCALAISIVTHHSEKEVKKHLTNVVNVTRLANQMQYWMTSEYIPDIKKNMVRDGVYENDTEIEVDFRRLRRGTFNNIHGCSIDKRNPDLGPVNGQEPIKEENKLIYWMINYIFVAYNNFRLSLKHLHDITVEKDMRESERIRSYAFRHLPNKNYHHIHALICHERSLQKTLSNELKTEFKQKAEMHKKQYAALSIQGIWKNYKNHHTLNSKEYKKNFNI